MTEADFFLAFSLSPSIGPKRFQSLLSHFGSVKSAWCGSEEEYVKLGIGPKTWSAFSTFRESFNSNYPSVKILAKKEIVFIPQTDPLYPQSLFMLENPPIGLYARGDSTCLSSDKTVGIVGSRTMTSYGADVTKYFASRLSTHDITIVSGMALGIDGVAHRATLDADGITIAVLGSGIDQPFPLENRDVYDRILKSSGCIISEYPPGMTATKGSFPARNRIVAALSNVLLVTEARAKSGALITAEIAFSLNIPVYAVPGPINASQSVGSLSLIQNGGKIALSPDDILRNFSINSRTSSSVEIDLSSLPETSQIVMQCVLNEPLSIDVLSKKCTMPIPQISQIITLLEMDGYVTKNETGLYIAVQK